MTNLVQLEHVDQGRQVALASSLTLGLVLLIPFGEFSSRQTLSHLVRN